MTQKMMVFVKSVEGVLRRQQECSIIMDACDDRFIINALNLVIPLKDFGPASTYIIHNFEIYISV